MRTIRLTEELGMSLLRAIEWGGIQKEPQPLGRAFRPTELAGYFNDLTSAAEHAGPVDPDGTPLLRGPRGELFYHPTVICQKALGHFDRWLLFRQDADRKSFCSLSEWLLRTQDVNGGWPCFRTDYTVADLGFPVGVPRKWFPTPVPYSGMVQGEAVSVLVRASKLNGGPLYLSAAERAFKLMTTDVSEGGVCHWEGEMPSIEEVPAEPRNTILNGWLFGMFGAWDLWLSTRSEVSLRFFERNFASLNARIRTFDLGWWSLYDERGDISRPFYQRLHVAQLDALAKVKRSESLLDVAARWARDLNSVNAAKARAAYALQRLTHLSRNARFQLRSEDDRTATVRD